MYRLFTALSLVRGGKVGERGQHGLVSRLGGVTGDPGVADVVADAGRRVARDEVADRDVDDVVGDLPAPDRTSDRVQGVAVPRRVGGVDAHDVGDERADDGGHRQLVDPVDPIEGVEAGGRLLTHGGQHAAGV